MLNFEETLQADCDTPCEKPVQDPYADYVIHPRGESCEGTVSVRPGKALLLEQWHMDCTDSVEILKIDTNCCYGEACRPVYCNGQKVCLTESNPQIYLTAPGKYKVVRTAGKGAVPKIRKDHVSMNQAKAHSWCCC